MANPVYSNFDEALAVLNEGQYGRDVRQAINDCFYYLTGEGAGAIDMTAREAVSDLQDEIEAAIYQMSLNGGRAKLLDETTVSTASSNLTLAQAISHYDKLWIHVEDAPATSSAVQIVIPNTGYTFPVNMPSNSTSAFPFDVFIDGITEDRASVKVVGEVYGTVAGSSATGTVKRVCRIDEFILPNVDDSNHNLDFDTRIIRITNIANAKVTVTGYGSKGTEASTATGLILDTNGIVHFS